MNHIKRTHLTQYCLAPAASLALLLGGGLHGATIFQAANTPTVAWEAEDVFGLANAAPTRWEVKADPTASGGAALYQSGDNKTDISSSFATYAIKFSTAGAYTLYVRWRGDETRTSQDPNGANSYRPANAFGDLEAVDTNFPVSTANNSRVPPAANNYGMIAEANATYTVTPAQVDEGKPLLLEIGTREWGMYIDRFVLSQNTALTESEFNALANSETDLIVQSPNDTFLAFEAERISKTTGGAPTTWVVRSDPTASSAQALYQAGDNKTDISSSFAYYSLKFKTPGAYTLYVRWRGDEARTSQDPNGANSYRPANAFGDLAEVDTNFPVSTANNSRVPPAANNYGMIAEANATYTVTQADVDSGQPLIFKIGTREWGMFIDRLVFSQNTALTEAEFNALPNSGSGARPSALKAAGSAALTRITITFDRAIKSGSVSAGKFAIPGLQVTAAAVDAATAKDVILTTSAQTEGARYEVTMSGIEDLAGNPIAPGSKVAFTAWKLSQGWVLREIYNVAGTSVADLQAAANFPDRPDSQDYIRSLGILTDQQVNDYGARLSTYFIPPTAGAYEFYLWADDDAQLLLGANLDLVIQSVPGVTTFTTDAMYVTANLTAGQRVPLQVLFKQSAGDAKVAVGARKAGSTGPVESIPVLGGVQVATFTNPDAGVVNIKTQPAPASAPAYGRARFSVEAATSSAGTLFYQWQKDGADIPGANRQVYVTPALTAADSGARYRVVISINGNNTTSQEAALTVTPGNPSPLQPYLGVNFVGGGNNSPGASLTPADVAGVVPQEQFNNLAGTTWTDTPLRDARGAATPVTLSVEVSAGIGIGSGEKSADDALFQGYIHNNPNPLVVKLANVPPDNYNLFIYSMGFNFNSTYEEDISLVGGGNYPLYTVQAEHVGEYLPSPAYRRMRGTQPTARDKGNYVQFENVSPAADGTLLLTLTNQSTNQGVGYHPPLNALQLVKVVPVAVAPTLTASRQTGGLGIAWGADATGFRLESRTTLGAGGSWTAVPGVPNPLAAAGSTVVTAEGEARYYRLSK